ncbi:unnamed protein product [Ambrosiozyma monospora]|uniref:Unnamed protein product n=1 Tax=Ambrosiozyma monospora TaxID=43982 RepID=A0ACB5TVG3_AMBMO|nr:unnamed protein product [Ambrosiozyma monospora]
MFVTDPTPTSGAGSADGDGDDPVVSLCICDTLLGTFKTSECTLSEMMLEITKTNPSEIVLLDAQYHELLRQFPDLQQYYITRLGPNHVPRETIELIQSEDLMKKKRTKTTTKPILDVAVLFEGTAKLAKSYINSLSLPTLGSAFILYNYLKECLPFNHKGIFYLPPSSPSTSTSTSTSASTSTSTTSSSSPSMHIDQTAAQDLELITTIRGGFKVGALANTIDRTVTTAGARLLNRWILEPSTTPHVIEQRQKLVGGFLSDYETSLEITQLLKRTGDLPRIVRRVGNGRVELAELRELAGSVRLLETILELIDDTDDGYGRGEGKGVGLKSVLMPLFDSVEDRSALGKLASKILKTVHQDVMLMNTETGGGGGGSGIDVVRRNWSICANASKKLKVSRAKYDEFVNAYDLLADSLTESFGEFGYRGKINLIRDLKSGCFVVELKSSSKVIPTMIKELSLEYVERTRGSVKISDSRWTKLGEQLVLLEQQIQIEESVILKALKQKIIAKSTEFIKLSSIIEQLDIAQSFASLAREKNLVCPKVDNSSNFEIVEGRHLVVEKGLQNHHKHHHHDDDYTTTRTTNFTPNSCTLTATHPHQS